MSDRIYTLKLDGGMAIMSLDDFTSLAGELTRYGVDVKIEPGSGLDQITFSLKETEPTQ